MITQAFGRDTVQWQARSDGELDKYGRATDTLADPVDVPVIGVSPSGHMDTLEPRRNINIEGWMVWGWPPDRPKPTDRDVITWRGKTFIVERSADDWTSGGGIGGIEVPLRLVEG